MKNILILHGSNDLYGASKVLLNIVDCLNKKGYKVHVILPFHGNLDKKLINRVHKLSHYNLGVFRKKYLNFLGFFNRFYKIIKSTVHVFNYIKKNEIDLVYINTSVIWSGVLASCISNRKNIVHIHEIPYGSNMYNFISGGFLNQFADSIIVDSLLGMRLSDRPSAPKPFDIGVAIIGMLTLLEATRSSLGLPLMIVAMILLGYTCVRPYQPVLIAGRGSP